MWFWRLPAKSQTGGVGACPPTRDIFAQKCHACNYSRAVILRSPQRGAKQGWGTCTPPFRDTRRVAEVALPREWQPCGEVSPVSLRQGARGCILLRKISTPTPIGAPLVCTPAPDWGHTNCGNKENSYIVPINFAFNTFINEQFSFSDDTALIKMPTVDMFIKICVNITGCQRMLNIAKHGKMW